MKGHVLIIAGSDSGGGAGIQADIKTVTALGGYAATAVTAITVQDTTAVHSVHPIPAAMVADQIQVVLRDIGADCIKIGMIGGGEVGEAISEALTGSMAPIILDPVLVASSGDALGDTSTADFIRKRLITKAALVTPNAPEAAALTGMPVTTHHELAEAAHRLHEMGASAVLAKGGHLAGEEAVNIVVSEDTEATIRTRRIQTRHTHGTGCTLASAVATFIAQGIPLLQACRQASFYVNAAIEHAPGLGRGHGPLNHALRPVVRNGEVVGYTPY